MRGSGFTRRAGLCGLAGLAPGLPALARAQDTRPITWIVPNGPGSAADIAARLVAPGLAARLGQPVVVENRPGAGGLVAAEAVAHAAPDGRTIFFGNSATFAIAPLMIPGLRFDALRDVAPVGGIGASWSLVVTAASGPYRTLPALVQAGRAAPGRLTCAVPVGSAQHLIALLFARAAGIEFNVVTSSTSGPVVQDTLAGRVDVAMEFVPTVQSLLVEGRLRALAVNAPRRIELLPEVPAVVEFGIAGADSATWSAVYVPVRTPQAIIARLAAALRAAVEEPQVRATILRLGGSPIPEADAPALTAMLEEDLRRYRSVFAEANFPR